MEKMIIIFTIWLLAGFFTACVVRTIKGDRIGDSMKKILTERGFIFVLLGPLPTILALLILTLAIPVLISLILIAGLIVIILRATDLLDVSEISPAKNSAKKLSPDSEKPFSLDSVESFFSSGPVPPGRKPPKVKIYDRGGK